MKASAKGLKPAPKGPEGRPAAAKDTNQPKKKVTLLPGDGSTKSEAKLTKTKALPIPDFGDSDEGEETLRVNVDFKKRFEDKERRRELSYLESQGIASDDDSDESDDSEADEDLAARGGVFDAGIAKVFID